MNTSPAPTARSTPAASGTLRFPFPTVHQQIRMRLNTQAHLVALHPGDESLGHPSH